MMKNILTWATTLIVLVAFGCLLNLAYAGVLVDGQDEVASDITVIQGDITVIEADIAVLETGKVDVVDWQGSNANLQASIDIATTSGVSQTDWQASNGVFAAQDAIFVTGKVDVVDWQGSNSTLQAQIGDNDTDITALQAQTNGFPLADEINTGSDFIQSMYFDAAGNPTQVVSAAASGGGSSAHTFQLIMTDWGGDAVGAGSLGTGTNNVVFTGYSTANATNNVNAGDAWYSSQVALNDKYYFSYMSFEQDTALAIDKLWVGVRSSSTDLAVNKINLLIDDTVNTFATNNLVSSGADVWNWYGPYETELPTAWTNTTPNWANGTFTNYALNFRVDAFCSNSNSIQCKIVVRQNTP